MSNIINRMDFASREWSQPNVAAKSVGSGSNAGERDLYSLGAKQNEEKKWDQAQISKEVDKLNDQMKAMNKSFRFKYSEEADQFYLQIIDMRSQEVIESIPSEFMIELSGKLKELVGLFIDKKL